MISTHVLLKSLPLHVVGKAVLTVVPTHVSHLHPVARAALQSVGRDGTQRVVVTDDCVLAGGMELIDLRGVKDDIQVLKADVQELKRRDTVGRVAWSMFQPVATGLVLRWFAQRHFKASQTKTLAVTLETLKIERDIGSQWFASLDSCQQTRLAHLLDSVDRNEMNLVAHPENSLNLLLSITLSLEQQSRWSNHGQPDALSRDRVALLLKELGPAAADAIKNLDHPHPEERFLISPSAEQRDAYSHVLQ